MNNLWIGASPNLRNWRPQSQILQLWKRPDDVVELAAVGHREEKRFQWERGPPILNVQVSDLVKELFDYGGVAEVQDFQVLAPNDGDQAAQVSHRSLFDAKTNQTPANFGNTARLVIVAGEEHLDAKVGHSRGFPDVQGFQVGTSWADNVE